MELPKKLLEQIVFITRPKLNEHMLIVMDESTHEEHISQPLQINKRQFKIDVTFLSGYSGTFNVTKKNNKFIFISVSEVVELNINTILSAAYEVESLLKEIKRSIIDEGCLTEDDYH